MNDGNKKVSESKNTGALELIVMRNAFYRDNYRRAFVVLLVLILVNFFLVGAIFYKIWNPPQPQYFATTADGRMISWHPLTDPVVTDDFVLQWSANAVRKAFSEDYMHWREQLQEASNNFTAQGWKYFIQSLQQSNNLETLQSLKMVSNAVLTGAPQISAKEVVGGVYAWKVQMPILVTYSNISKTIPMPMVVTLIILRVPVEQNPDRIAINNFLPVAQKTAEQQLLQGGGF
jgi:intracellular multiplication protein IcmL